MAPLVIRDASEINRLVTLSRWVLPPDGRQRYLKGPKPYVFQLNTRLLTALIDEDRVRLGDLNPDAAHLLGVA